jgi:hypothetical protein
MNKQSGDSPTSYCDNKNSCNSREKYCQMLPIDIAVLCEDILPIEIAKNSHIVELDKIRISEDHFKEIFYPYGEFFCIDKTKIKSHLFKYITFLSPWRTLDENPFSLLNTIISNIECDLNVTRNCFTTCTLLNLSKEISCIKTLADINCCSVVCSLTWSNIISIIKENYNLNDNSTYPNFNITFIISVVFKSPNTCVLPTIVKFKYEVEININKL